MSLTPRQQQIGRLLAEAKSYKEIARTVGCSVRTVEVHVHRAASLLPGPGRPRDKLTVFFLSIEEDSDAA